MPWKPTLFAICLAFFLAVGTDTTGAEKGVDARSGPSHTSDKFAGIKTVDELLRFARGYEASNLKVAAEFYTEAARRAPSSSKVYQGRARVRTAQSFLVYAMADLNEAIRLDPKVSEFYTDRARLNLKTKMFRKAAEDAGVGIELENNNAEAYNIRARAHVGQESYLDASRDFELALKLNPSFAEDSDFLAIQKEVNERLWRSHNGVANTVSPNNATPQAVSVPSMEQAKASGPLLAAAPAPPAVNTPVLPSLAAVPEVRVALVIGNGAYDSAERLDNPGRDAAAVASALRDAGFKTVHLKSNLRYDEMRRALNDFSAEADRADWAVVYYAGHGIEVGGINYLIPVDARLKTDRAVGFEAVPLDQVLTSIEGAHKLRLVILDACRDNPFVQRMARTLASRSIGQGLAKVELGDSATLVAFAAKHGQQAADGIAGQINSPFVTALIDSMAKPRVDIRRMFGMVRDQVLKSTRRQQEPYVYGSLGGDEYLFKQQ